eukprot:6331495-Alexandrium_andersonii.AAC.1
MSACPPLRTPVPNIRHECGAKTRPKPHATLRRASPFADKTVDKRTANGRIGSARRASRIRRTT